MGAVIAVDQSPLHFAAQAQERALQYKKTPQGLLLSQCSQKGANLRYSAEAQGEAA
jgi:hypothetical protein